jgi:hypothetical protein
MVLHIIGMTVEDLIWRNSALELAMGQVATSLDNSNATNAFWRATQRLLTRNEERELQLIIGVQSVQPWEDLLRRWERLSGDVVERLYQRRGRDAVQNRVSAQLFECCRWV